MRWIVIFFIFKTKTIPFIIFSYKESRKTAWLPKEIISAWSLEIGNPSRTSLMIIFFYIFTVFGLIIRNINFIVFFNWFATRMTMKFRPKLLTWFTPLLKIKHTYLKGFKISMFYFYVFKFNKYFKYRSVATMYK